MDRVNTQQTKQHLMVQIAAGAAVGVVTLAAIAALSRYLNRPTPIAPMALKAQGFDKFRVYNLETLLNEPEMMAYLDLEIDYAIFLEARGARGSLKTGWGFQTGRAQIVQDAKEGWRFEWVRKMDAVERFADHATGGGRFSYSGEIPPELQQLYRSLSKNYNNKTLQEAAEILLKRRGIDPKIYYGLTTVPRWGDSFPMFGQAPWHKP